MRLRLGTRTRTVLALAAAVLAGSALTVGTATAAATIGSSEIRNQSIQSWDIAAGGVASSEVRQQSLKSWDISEGGVGTSEIRDGSVADEDLSSEVRGKLGVPGYEVDGFYTTAGPSPNAGEPIPAGADWEVRTAQCAEGKHAIGGGFSGSGGTAEDAGGPDTTLVAKASYASGLEPIKDDPEGSVKATSWSVAFANTGDTAQVGRVWVICASVS